MNRFDGKSGQASLEALFTIPLFFTAVLLLLTGFTSAKSFFWVRYQLHEAVICLQDSSESHCRKKFYQKVAQTIPFCRIEYLYLQKYPGHDSGRLQVAIQLHQIYRFEMSQKIKRRW